MGDNPAGDSKHRVHCQHPGKILTGQGNQLQADGIMKRIRSWWCDDCGQQWTSSDEYTTEAYYGIDE